MDGQVRWAQARVQVYVLCGGHGCRVTAGHPCCAPGGTKTEPRRYHYFPDYLGLPVDFEPGVSWVVSSAAPQVLGISIATPHWRLVGGEQTISSCGIVETSMPQPVMPGPQTCGNTGRRKAL